MTSLLELAANVVMATSIVLAGRNSVHTWWTGIVGCLLFAVLFQQSQLYADVALQIFFVATSAMGWWQWIKGDAGRPLSVSRAQPRLFAWIVPAGVAATVAYGAVLHTFTDAYAPYIDSAVLVFSVCAQLLLMQRRLESWAFWILVNTIAAPLYASRGLYLTSLLYVAYWINAVIALSHWRALALGNAPARSSQGA